MTRYYALALVAISCACGTVSETPSDGPNLSIVTVPQTQQASLPNEDGSAPKEVAHSTVPMTGDNQKENTLDAIARAIHIYWFFGSR